MFKSLWKLINYWYFRYLLVTELYMVEKWERVMILFYIIFSIIALFNSRVVLGLVKTLYEPSSNGLVESVMDMGIISGGLVAYTLATKR